MVVPDDEAELLSLRLKFAQPKLYGRSREVRQLHAVYQRLCQKSSNSIVSNGTTKSLANNTAITSTLRGSAAGGAETSSNTALHSVSETTTTNNENSIQQHLLSSPKTITTTTATTTTTTKAGVGAVIAKHGHEDEVEDSSGCSASGVAIDGDGASVHNKMTGRIMTADENNNSQGTDIEQQQDNNVRIIISSPSYDDQTETGPSSSEDAGPDNYVDSGSEVVLITGPSGCGKTALVYKFMDELEGLQQQGQDHYYHYDRPSVTHLHTTPQNIHNHHHHNNNNNNNQHHNRNNHHPRGTTTCTHSTTMSSLQGDVTTSGFVPDRHVPNLPCFFLSGKFEDQRDNNPYSAFVEAFSGFCNILLQEHRHGLYDPAIRQIRHDIQQAIGTEGRVLTDVIPDLIDVIGEQPESSQSSSKENALYRLKYVFKNFLMAIGRPHRPIVLFLDDLQWADGASLDLIDTILKDPAIQHLFFIGAYRSSDEGTTTITTTRTSRALGRNMNSMKSSSSLTQEDDNDNDNNNNNNNTDTTAGNGDAQRQQQHSELSCGPSEGGTGVTTKLITNSTPLMSSLQIAKPNLERINLNNLPKDVLREYIWDTLDLPGEETDALTNVLYSKTNGNIFFTVQSLEKLHRRNILTYSQTSKQWDLDIDALLQHTKEEGKGQLWLSDTVVDVVVDKLKSLPASLQRALSIAAFIRSSFDIDTLQDVLQMELEHQHKLKVVDGSLAPKLVTADLIKLLDNAVVQGLLTNNMGSSNYKFAHDRIQEAACSLVGPEERNALLVRVGKKLVQRADKCGEDWMLYVAADHFHKVSPFPGKLLDPAEIAALNLQVGELAGSISAFHPASKYLRQGLECLRYIRPPGASPVDTGQPRADWMNKKIPKEWAPSVFSWHSHYDLSLQLYRTAAEIEFILGNHDFGMKLSEEIFRHAKSLSDMLPTYSAVGNSFGRLSRHAEGLEWNLKALKRLGHFPKRFQWLYIMVDLRVVRMAFRRYTDYDILLLPKLTDPALLATMEMLATMSLRAWFCRMRSQFLVCVLRQLRITFKHGICGYTAQALACYGSFLAGDVGDEEGSLRMGRLALQVIDECNAKHMEAIVLNIISGFIEAWSIPLPQVLEAFDRGRSSGFETGELEFSYFNWVSKSLYSFAAGYTLQSIEKELEEMLPQLKKYNVESCLAVVVQFRLFISQLRGRHDTKKYNLLGWDDNGTDNGSQTTMHTSSSAENRTSKTKIYHVKWAYWSQLQLSYYFGDYSIAKRIADTYDSVGGKTDKSYISLSLVLFFSGLTASGLARQTFNRKYKDMAKKAMQKMKAIVRRCGLTSLHRYYIMEADYLLTTTTTDFKFKRVKTVSGPEKFDIAKSFDRAISAVTGVGITQDIALSHELAGEFYARCADDSFAKHHFLEARNFYYKWGAKAKVEDLLKKRARYFEGSKELPLLGVDVRPQVVSFAWSAS